MTQVSDLENRQAYITQQSGFIRQLQEGMHTTIIGQEHLVESLLIGLLADGHILLEGCRLQPHTVYPRPTPSRPHRYADLQSAQ